MRVRVQGQQRAAGPQQHRRLDREMLCIRFWSKTETLPGNQAWCPLEDKAMPDPSK